MLHDYCEEKSLPRRTLLELKKQYSFWYSELQPYPQEVRILELLPWSLRKEIILYMHQVPIDKLSLFRVQQMPDWLAALMVRMLQPEAFTEGQFIIGPNEVAEHQQVFFVFEGTVEAYTKGTEPATDLVATPTASLVSKFTGGVSTLNTLMQSGGGEKTKEGPPPLAVFPPGASFGLEEMLFTAEAAARADSASTNSMPSAPRTPFPFPKVCYRCSEDAPCLLYTLSVQDLQELRSTKRELAQKVCGVLANVLIMTKVNCDFTVVNQQTDRIASLPSVRGLDEIEDD